MDEDKLKSDKLRQHLTPHFHVLPVVWRSNAFVEARLALQACPPGQRFMRKCPKSNLTNVLDEFAGILDEYCAKSDHIVNALKANVEAFCTNWYDQFVQSCKELKGCDKTTCTFDKAVNDIAFAYTEDSVKYATSFVKFLRGRAVSDEQDDLPLAKGCDIIYRPWNAANGLHATGVVLVLTSCGKFAGIAL
ncbi:hypothetical protein AAVH_22056 [Aphelenchoides avenae]|nr:hypothetical protein AAVH_22056 [Aphelenchus avenae]